MLADVGIVATDQNHAIRVDQVLELGLQECFEFTFFVSWFFIGLLITIFVEGWWLLFRSLARDVEHLFRGVIADGVTVEHVTAVLAIILT